MQYRVGFRVPHVIAPRGPMVNKSLTSSSKLVLAWILARKGEKWVCYWRQQDIAEELGLSERAVRDSLAQLEEQKYIIKVPDVTKSGCPNSYIVTDHPDYPWDLQALKIVVSVMRSYGHHSVRAANPAGLSAQPEADSAGFAIPANFAAVNVQAKFASTIEAESASTTGFDYISGKETSVKENNPLPPNLAIPSVATNGSQDLDISFSPKENQTNTTDFDGKQVIREAKPYEDINISEREALRDSVALLPLPPTPLPAAAPLTGYEDESWEPRMGISRWSRTKGLPKLNAEAKRWIEHIHEQGVGSIPWSTVESALEAFTANEEMKGKGYPYRAFWKNPAAWSPNRQETRQNAPGRFQGSRTPTTQPPAAPGPTSAPTVAYFVETWNRDNPHSETDATIANSWDWKECIQADLFRREFSRIAQWCGFLRDECGLTHVNLPWVLRKQHGVKKRNWERLLDGDFLPAGWNRYPQTREDADAQKRDSDAVFRDLAAKQLPPMTEEEREISRQKDIERKEKLKAWMAECRAKAEAKRQAELRAVIESPDYDPFAAIAGVEAV